jgi:hypothetical protein
VLLGRVIRGVEAGRGASQFPRRAASNALL